MNILASAAQNAGIIVLIVIGVLVLIAGLVLLYIFVISRNSVKRQIKDLERKYSYLDALLLGQDSQYIHRLEIVSRTNLLYVEIYNNFSRRFKEIYEIDDKYADSKIKQAKNMVANKQYKNIKTVIEDTKKSVQMLEDRVNTLDKDLFEVIKPEEESRQAILKLKESYRAVKQTFYASSNDLELVVSSFNKAFDKLDKTFSDFEAHIDSAEYDEANALLPLIGNVVNALKAALEQMPNLCIYITKILPEKMVELNQKYEELEQNGYPLFHLSYRSKVDDWNYRLNQLRKKLISLEIMGVKEECDSIQKEIEDINVGLDKEEEDKEYFIENNSSIYKSVSELDNSFLKVCSIFPEVEKIYKVEQTQYDQLDSLKESFNKMAASKRTLDTYIHSSTPQPYSVLRQRLENLQENYVSTNISYKAFVSYLDSLKSSSEEAYNMVFAYYYRLRTAEDTLSAINLPDFAKLYQESIENCYTLLNDIDKTIKVKPIDVTSINQKVEELKSVAATLFDEIDTKCRECQLAESAIVYANRDRIQQETVNQKLNVLEEKFFQGDFQEVYHETTDLFQKSHIEDSTTNAQ